MQPGYIRLHQTGELRERAAEAWERLRACDLCPRRCGVNRLAGERGKCGQSAAVRLSPLGFLYGSFEPYFGGNPFTGRYGAGKLWFGGCSLRCLACPNGAYLYGYLGTEEVPLEELVRRLLEAQANNRFAVALVNATPFVPHVLRALDTAAGRGFRLPLILDTSGYEAVDTLRLLEGVVSVYIPDLKTASPEAAQVYCGARDYPEVAKEAIREMHRQVGDLVLSEDWVAEKGVLVRHLVLPEGLAGTGEAMRFLSTLSPRIAVNILSCYWPYHKAAERPPFNRCITRREYKEALAAAKGRGIDLRHSLIAYRRLVKGAKSFGKRRLFHEDWEVPDYAHPTRYYNPRLQVELSLRHQGGR